MTFTKNIGMLLLAIYLILVGLIAVVGFNFGLFQGSSLFSLASSSPSRKPEGAANVSGNRPPARQVGYTAEQRAAIRAVEEEGTLELINDFLRRANAMADRLELYARTPKPGGNGKGA